MTSQKAKSVIFILLWALSFTASMSLLKTLHGSVPTVILVFTRSIFGCLVSGGMVSRYGLKALQTNRLPLHFFRILLGAGGIFCTYYAYSVLPLALATSIGFTGPLMTTLMALLFLGESISRQRWMGILVGYAGVLLIVRPEGGMVSLAILVALAANIFASGSIITAKKLSGTDHPAVIMALSNGINFLLMAIPAFIYWRSFSLKEILLLCGVGLCGSISQYFQINAIRWASPSFLAPFEYLRLVFALPIGWFFFNEAPSLIQFLGSLTIIGGTYYVTKSEKQNLR
jgi:drug/metabolite transporter (DMT)-like permease